MALKLPFQLPFGKQKEVEGLIKEAGFKIKESWREGKDPRTNIYVVAQKVLSL